MSKGFYYKLHKNAKDAVVAICDEEILGQTFRGEKLKITINSGFYEGEILTEEELRAAIKNCTILNIVGNRAVALAIEEGVIDADCVIQIGEVKHAQAVLM